MNFIGITLDPKESVTKINNKYLTFIINSGYLPLPIVPGMSIKQYDHITSKCVALLLPGGIDIDPTYYWEDNLYSLECDPEKDAFERTVLNSFNKQKKPVFGICRGFQLIAREFLTKKTEEASVLSFYQHIQGHNQTSSTNSKRTNPTHSVMLNPKQSLYAVPMKGSHIFVNSLHHQALVVSDFSKHQANSSLKILATSTIGIDNKDTKSKVIEAFAIDNFCGSTVMGVQWHPEELDDYAIFRDFVEKNSAANLLEKTV